MSKTVILYTYDSGISGLEMKWRFSEFVTWAEYQRISKVRPGEGKNWKAELAI